MNNYLSFVYIGHWPLFGIKLSRGSEPFIAGVWPFFQVCRASKL